MEKEAKNYASILGYNYNSSQWFEESYKIFNKTYKPLKRVSDKEDDSLLKNIFKNQNKLMEDKKNFQSI